MKTIGTQHYTLSGDGDGFKPFPTTEERLINVLKYMLYCKVQEEIRQILLREMLSNLAKENTFDCDAIENIFKELEINNG